MHLNWHWDIRRERGQEESIPQFTASVITERINAAFRVHPEEEEQEVPKLATGAVITHCEFTEEAAKRKTRPKTIKKII